MNSNKPTSIDEYIAGFPADVQKKLWQLLEVIKKSAPGAEEVISYGMPMLRLQGRLLYFAAFKKHIGFYPMASGITAFKSKLKGYKWARGSVQFPLDKPVPVSLVSQIVKFRVKENIEKVKKKTKLKSSRKR